MTERDRFWSAFGSVACDRPPMYEQAFASNVGSDILGRRAHTGAVMLHYEEAVAAIKGPEAHEAFLRQVEEDVIDLARTLGWGAVAPPWLRGRPTQQVGEFDFLYGDPDGAWTICRYDPEACSYGPIRQSRPPQWHGPEAIGKAVDAQWRSVEAWGESQEMQLRASTKHWLDLADGRFEVLGRGGGLSVPLNEEWMIACALAPDLVEAYLKAQVAAGIQRMAVQSDMGLRIVWGGGDLADNRGPLYGPRFFVDRVLPRYRELAEAAHRHGMVYFFRSDGDLRGIADGLLGEGGVDGYGEIDYDAGMRIPDLLGRYPRVTCWGNVSSRLLRLGSPDDIRREVETLMEEALPKGRWILGSSNSILAGTPAENVMAMYHAAGG